MRIKFEGRWTLKQLHKVIGIAIEQVEKNGADEATGINFYMNLWSDGKEVDIVNKYGESINYVYKSPNKRKKLKKKSSDVISLSEARSIKDGKDIESTTPT